MWLKVFILSCFLVLVARIGSTQKWDYQIPYGSGNTFYGTHFNLIDFNDSSVSFIQSAQGNFLIGTSNSAIASKDGALRLVTNGCGLYDSNFSVVESIDTITPHPRYFWDCIQHHDSDVIGNRRISHIFLPNLSDPNEYWLLHRSDSLYTYFGEEYATGYRFFLSKMRSDPSGTIFGFERDTLDIGFSVSMGFSAISNASQTGWWFYNVDFEHRDSIDFYCLYPDSLYGPVRSAVHPTDRDVRLIPTKGAFSNDGTKLALATDQKTAFVYQFDTSTGEVVFDEEIVAGMPGWFVGALNFSPNNQFLYITKIYDQWSNDFHQVDLHDPDPISRQYDYGKAFGRWSNFYVGVGYLAPDCRMYFAPTESGEAMSILKYPNRKGAASGFTNVGINAPGFNYSFPNMPNYRVLSPCDSTISLGLVVSTEQEQLEALFTIAPNPVEHTLTLYVTTPQVDLDLHIVDALGQIHQTRTEQLLDGQLELDVADLPKGIYFLQLQGFLDVQKFVKL